MAKSKNPESESEPQVSVAFTETFPTTTTTGAVVPPVEPKPAPAAKAAEIEWRVELRHTPVGSFARLVRTQTAATPEEAWEKFKVAVTAAVAQVQTNAGREVMRMWEAWLAEHGGRLPPQHGRVVPEAEVTAVIERARLRAPAEA